MEPKWFHLGDARTPVRSLRHSSKLTQPQASVPHSIYLVPNLILGTHVDCPTDGFLPIKIQVQPLKLENDYNLIGLSPSRSGWPALFFIITEDKFSYVSCGTSDFASFLSSPQTFWTSSADIKKLKTLIHPSQPRPLL